MFNASKIIIKIDEELKNSIKSKIQINGFERAGCIMGKLYPRKNMIEITHVLEAEYKDRNEYYVETCNITLNKEVSRIWEDSEGRITYVGDWHTHPESYPTPSEMDIETSHKKFKECLFDQNILIDLIIGTKENHIRIFDGINFYNTIEETK